jgi:hypothetical protein
MLELSLHIDAAVIERRSLLIVEKQREVSPWNVTPAGQSPDKVGNRTLPSPKAGGMGRGSAASQTGLEVSLTRRSSC